MKLKNTTTWSDSFLRRMVSWACGRIVLPVRAIRRAEFGNRSKGMMNGVAWCNIGRIRVVIGPDTAFPSKPYIYPGRTGVAFETPSCADRLEALVLVTAHEVEHLYSTKNQSARIAGSERFTCIAERKAIQAFRENREALVQSWSIEKPKKATISLPEKRRLRAEKSLSNWERKAKLAKTKITKLRRTLTYYGRKGALTSPKTLSDAEAHDAPNAAG